MSLAATVPLLGVTTLEVVARAALDGSRNELLVLMDTKRADFYAQAFDGWGTALGEPVALPPPNCWRHFRVPDLRLAGDAAERPRSCSAKWEGREAFGCAGDAGFRMGGPDRQ